MAPTQSFNLTPKQIALRDCAASPARHILAYGGSRSGKTVGFCYCIAMRALSAPGSRHLIARLHNIDVRQAVMMDTWPALMRRAFAGVPYAVKWQDQFATFENGAEVWFGGLDEKDRSEKILGKEYATVYVNEASQVPFQTILTMRTRLAQNVTKVNGAPLALKAYYDLNPVGQTHWTYREFVQNVRPDNRMPLEPGIRAVVTLNPEDNPHLPPAYLDELGMLPERQRQRFFEGKYLSETPGTLWPLDRIDGSRVAAKSVPHLARVVVGVDPSGSDGAGGDAQGIVTCGIDAAGHGYVLADDSCRRSPAGWASAAIAAYHNWNADLIVAEANYGGAMVENTIRGIDPRVPVRLVNASRGKHVRAEPIAGLYETRPERPGRVHHAGIFGELEEQMGLMTSGGYTGSGSPDRLDALVWALSELMLGASTYTLAFVK